MVLKRYIETQSEQEFDAIIVGGGITGAAVAYAAASKGLKILLLEKKDFGGATSAATSKLIHGGLRYLANMELKLVRESLTERRVLGNIAPNFVYPVPFLLPSYISWKGNMWKLGIGMYLYDWLSFDKTKTWDKTKRLPNHKIIPASKAMQMEPGLVSHKLRNATIFYDYQSIFPERLTLAFIKSAVEYGAQVSNYAEVTSFVYTQPGKIGGVNVHDALTGRNITIKGKLIINCAGTWADKILNMALGKTETSHKITRSEGIHIITKRIANDHVVSLMRKDGGHMMIMPWRGHTLIGTTDKVYNGDPDNYKVSRESLEEVLVAVNENYGRKIDYNDILFAYGGLRPLVDTKKSESYNASRKYEIYDNAADGVHGLITVEGGKYTTSRHLAQSVIELVGKKINQNMNDSITYKLYLSGCEIRDMNEFMKKQHLQYSDFKPETVEYISRNYGTESAQVFEIARSNPKWSKVITADGELLAEVVYAIRHEMALTLKDIMLRRTGTGTLGHPGEDTLQAVLNTAAELLHWDEERKLSEYQSVMQVFQLPV